MALTFPIRQYSGAANTALLLTNIASSGEGTFQIDTTNAATWTDVTTSSPGHNGSPLSNSKTFVVVVDYGTANEEKILCSGMSGNTITIASGGRGYDGTNLAPHNVNAQVVPCITATEFAELQYLIRQVLDNLQSPGDIVYASGSKTLTRVGLGLQGGVLYAGATAPQYSAPGSANTFLKSDGTGAVVWSNLPVPTHAEFNNASGTAQSITSNSASDQQTTLTFSSTATYTAGTSVPTMSANVVTINKAGLYKVCLKTTLNSDPVNATSNVYAPALALTTTAGGASLYYGSSALYNQIADSGGIVDIVVPFASGDKITPKISFNTITNTAYTVAKNAGKTFLQITYLGPIS